ncbi:MAG TPA: MBL fold metallo-hydrolase [Polyangia bacterium]|jgi:glyoxylase-like metal-dependent hydrolase (beta-lactamase superfamily II)
MRYLKVLLVLVIVAAAIGGGAAFGLRAGRNKVGTPSVLKPDFFVVTNAMGIGLFAARVAPGPHVIFFDTGLDPEGRPVDALLRALGASRDDVTDVFLTHGHFDHVAGARVLTNARLHLGAPDVPLAAGQIQPDALVPMLLGKVLATPPVTANAPMVLPATFPVGAPSDAGATKMVKAYPTPGHTPGSYVFLYDGVLIAGDIMVLKQGRLDPPPRVFNPHPAENEASIKSLKTQLAGEAIDIVCTSHGGCTPKGLGRMLLDELITRLGG